MGSVAGDRPSGRELQVLRMAACGPSNARIADALHISEASVKRHLANAYEKLGARRAPKGAVYRCVAPGCGREVVEVRPPAVRQPGARLSCHGREMDRTGPPEG